MATPNPNSSIHSGGPSQDKGKQADTGPKPSGTDPFPPERPPAPTMFSYSKQDIDLSSTDSAHPNTGLSQAPIGATAHQVPEAYDPAHNSSSSSQGTSRRRSDPPIEDFMAAGHRERELRNPQAARGRGHGRLSGYTHTTDPRTVSFQMPEESTHLATHMDPWNSVANPSTIGTATSSLIVRTMAPEHFDGTQDPRRWMQRFERDGAMVQGSVTGQIAPGPWLTNFNSRMEGEAADWADEDPVIRQLLSDESIEEASPTSVEEVKKLFIIRWSRHPTKAPETNYVTAIQDLRQGEKESLTTFYHRALMLCRTAGGSDRIEGMSQAAVSILDLSIERFVSGLSNPQLRMKMKRYTQKPNRSLQGALLKAEAEEQQLKEQVLEAKRMQAEARNRILIQVGEYVSRGEVVPQDLAHQLRNNLVEPIPTEPTAVSTPIQYLSQSPSGTSTQQKNQWNPSQPTTIPLRDTPHVVSPVAPPVESNTRYPQNNNYRRTQNVFDPLTSSNPYVRGDKVHKHVPGNPLCFKCGTPGHISPRCENPALSPMERSHLVKIVREQQQRSAESMVNHIQTDYMVDEEFIDLMENLTVENYSIRSPFSQIEFMDEDHIDLEGLLNMMTVECLAAKRARPVVETSGEEETARRSRTQTRTDDMVRREEEGLRQHQEQAQTQNENLDQNQPHQTQQTQQFLPQQQQTQRQQQSHVQQQPVQPTYQQSQPIFQQTQPATLQFALPTQQQFPAASLPTQQPMPANGPNGQQGQGTTAVTDGRKKAQARGQGVGKARKAPKPIQGRVGKPPVSLLEVLDSTSISMSFLELCQISPYFAGEAKRLASGVRVPRQKKKARGMFASISEVHSTTSPSIQTKHVSFDETAETFATKTDKLRAAISSWKQQNSRRAFGLDAIVWIPQGDKQMPESAKKIAVKMHRESTIADAGSDINLIYPGLVARLGLELRPISDLGVKTFNMKVANGQSVPLKHWVKINVSVNRIRRTVWAFVNPQPNAELLLLLGTPWLASVDAKLGVRSGVIELGDVRVGETPVQVAAPELPSSGEKKAENAPMPNLEDSYWYESTDAPSSSTSEDEEADNEDECDDSESTAGDSEPEADFH